MKRLTANKITSIALLTALALILSYLESLLPAFIPVPGIKLGLANLAVLLALYLLGTKSALLINVLRILLSAMLFGTAVSLVYALAGALCSFLIMYLLKKSGRFSMTAVSICGGVFHNLGQILIAMLILESSALTYYLPVLWFAGLLSGFFIGLLGGWLATRLQPVFDHA